jgi:adenylyltransferase/sulfurtransferase
MEVEREWKRYERQLGLIGKRGQKKLKRAKVFIAGAGGLGTAVLTYLAAAGIGKIEIVDKDSVHLSNLNRQGGLDALLADGDVIAVFPYLGGG